MYLLLSIPEKVEALEHVRNLREVSDQTSVSLLQKKMASAIVQLHGITIDQELILNLPLPEAPVESQDCSSRFFRWADAIDLGDQVYSERLLREMNSLGYSGLAVGYFSKRLPRDQKRLAF